MHQLNKVMAKYFEKLQMENIKTNAQRVSEILKKGVLDSDESLICAISHVVGIRNPLTLTLVQY